MDNILSDAEWIGTAGDCANTMSAKCYEFSCRYEIESGECAKIVLAARNMDNYLLFEADAASEELRVYDVCDNAWEDGVPMKTLLAKRDAAVGSGGEFYAAVDDGRVTVTINGGTVICGEKILPDVPPIVPVKYTMMLVGFDGRGCRVKYRDIKLTDTKKGVTYSRLPFYGSDGVEVVADGGMELANAVPAPMLRKKFNVTKDVARVLLYASARGFCDSYINKRRVSDERYAPGFTDYRLRIDYRKYDVTPLVKSGENVISAAVGAGYYNGYAGYNRRANVYGDKVSYIAKLVLEYRDGSCEEIVTDNSWEAAFGVPIIYADYLQGEYYDARFGDGVDWHPCETVSKPDTPVPTNGRVEGLRFTMTEAEYPPARPVMELEGKYIGEIPEGHRIYDFGRNMVGTVRVRMRGRRGAAVKIRYCEMCRKDGSAYVANLRSAANTDVYIFAGDGEEVFEPTLTEHGFRYAEISGCGGTLEEIEILEITGIVISNISDVTGGFECSNELLNKLYTNIVWGERGNYLLVPTDCPQRNERMGWTGDAQVFARTAAYNMDVLEFTRKWLRDLREAQLMYNRDGAVPDTAPLCGDNRPSGCGGWGDAAVIVPWEMYRAYGDERILRECYPMMREWVEYLAREDRRGYGERVVDGMPAEYDRADAPYIQVQQRRGDHLAFDESTPFILSATAYAAHVTEIFAEVAQILGKTDDGEKYGELAERIKSAFRSAWVKPDGTLGYWGEMKNKDVSGIYFSDAPESVHHPSQTAYALAIDFGIIDAANPRVRECFRRTIAERSGKLSVGFLGISHLLPALLKCGLKKEAFELMEQEDCPGWLYSVVNGATTIWERWNSYIAKTGEFGNVAMNSFNHYAYGAIGQTFFETILGINPDKAGYESVLLRPTYGGTLTYAKGYHITPHGRVESEWRLGDEEFEFKFRVPDGVRTRVVMPGGTEYTFRGGAHIIREKL